MSLCVWLLAATLFLLAPDAAAAGNTPSADELAGLWKATHDYTPDASGALVLQKTAGGWLGDFRGCRIVVQEADGILTFAMPDRGGAFRARLQPDGSLGRAQWFQPASPANPPFGSAITFERVADHDVRHFLRRRQSRRPRQRRDDDQSGGRAGFVPLLYMRAPMGREPGTEAVYCSGDPNLAVGVLDRASGEHPMDLFDRLLGEPLQIAHHCWYLSPSRQPYGGGSTNLLPRDFMKLGQLMLDKGSWKGRRVLSEDFVRRASSPTHDLNGIKYGYLWWGVDFPYKNRTVHAYFAGGNGGQGLLVMPELDLVIATYGSNYSSRLGLEIQQGLTPRYILPAVREAGDATVTPVVPREYKVIYGRKPRIQPAPPS